MEPSAVTGVAQTDQEILKQFTTAVMRQIVTNARAQKRVATGKSIAGLRDEVTGSEAKIIDGAGYTEWGWEYGRRPGRIPPFKAIEEWIEAKGISPKGNITKSQLARRIAFYIGKHGTKLFRQGEPSGVITDVITPARINTLAQTFATRYKYLITSEILREFTIKATA